MTIGNKTYELAPGASSITDPDLAYVQIHRIRIEGRGYNLTQAGVASGRNCYHFFFTGVLELPVTGTGGFDPSSSVDTPLMKVQVIYKY